MCGEGVGLCDEEEVGLCDEEEGVEDVMRKA